jgi:tetratricopeptide (TPR) repeat protein
MTLKRERLLELLDEHPESKELWLEYARLLHNELYDPRAEALAWRRVESFFPERDYGLLLGDALCRSGQWREGLILIYRFVESNPTVFAHRILARHLIAKGKSRRARKIIRNALLIKPNDAETLFLLGQALPERLEKQAVGYYRRAVDSNPRLDEAWLALGMSLIQNPDSRAEGVQALMRADQLFPNDFVTQMSLGHAYAMSGEHDKALPYFELATELDPSSETASYFHADCLRRLESA